MIRHLCLALVIVAAPIVTADAETEIVHAHAAWRDALIARDGAAAWARADQRTRDFCQRVLEHVWHADQNALSLLPATAMVLVVQARSQIPRDELLALNGEGFFHHAVRNGWLDNGLLEGQSIEDVHINGDTATGVQKMGEQVYPIPMRFAFESGVWRVDMTSAVKETSVAFRQQAQVSGMTPLQLVLNLLEAQSGEALSPDVTKPLRR